MNDITGKTDVTESVVFDVVVIGAGIVGSAVARKLAAYELDVAMLDARDDVGDGTSKANTAILHTGFDATPGTLESRLVREGYHLLSDYAARTGIPVEHTGAVLVAWTAEELDALPGLQEKAERNGYTKTEIIDCAEVYRQLPHLGEGVLGGLTVPDESIICTWTTNLALATDAVGRGVTLLLNRAVLSAEDTGDATVLRTSGGEVRARWVVNAAGLGSDVVDRLFGHDRFTVTPRRGELVVYDKLARPLVNKIILPVPSSRGKGVLISPTVYGNVLLGPTAEDLTDRTDTGTSEKGLEFLMAKGERLMPDLLREEVTATYAGLRAASDHPDYLVEADSERRYVLVGGIRSTGLTAGIAIAEYVAEIARDAGLALVPREDLPEPPRMPNLGEATTRPYQDAARIAADPAYGKVVCFCERVTAGEIRDAFRSPIPPAGLEGLRRRTRALNGRCQGFYCGAEIAGLLECESARAHDRESVRDGEDEGTGEDHHAPLEARR
ncbi:NAD(P)/FAD-dependent oxidoreductase [Streptosporangium sp. DT93]|uniref:NAD(P)/FAD-dependent oxidoreductase n=1 Tax=Streptosporangium sp. DT93 TaxID=3393428 RepID=UPI003CF0293E